MRAAMLWSKETSSLLHNNNTFDNVNEYPLLIWLKVSMKLWSLMKKSKEMKNILFILAGGGGETLCPKRQQSPGKVILK